MIAGEVLEQIFETRVLVKDAIMLHETRLLCPKLKQ